MSDPHLIEPSGILQFTGDLDSLDLDTLALTAEAGAFRDAGAGIHSNFQSMAAFYKAPEAEQLFATTAPVASKTAAFADDLEKVSGALSAYSQEVRPLAAKLRSLQAEATAFTQSVAGDADWREDKDKVEHNNDLWHDVNSTLDAFWAAERTCHNKIAALIGGTQLTTDDGSHQPHTYGFKADDLNHSKSTPWGAAVEQEYSGFSWLLHQGKSFFWDGFIVDGVWGTIRGLGTLVGVDGWDAASQAWTSLGKLATGVLMTSLPGVQIAFLATPDSQMPKWFRDSRNAVEQTGKALVAYDEWGKNPSRAAGGVVFNVVTTAFTGGAGNAAKAGAVAKTLSAVGKAGRLVDPMTYVFKAGTLATFKVGDIFTSLKAVHAGAYNDILSGAGYLQPDGTVLKFGDGVPVVKGDVIEWPNGTRFDTRANKVYGPDGAEIPAQVELSAADRAALQNSVPNHAPAMVGGHPEGSTVGHADGHSRTTPGSTGGHASSGVVHGRGQGSSWGSDARSPLTPHGGDTGHTGGPSSHGGGHGGSDAGHGAPDGIPHPGGEPEQGRPHGDDTSPDGASRELNGQESKAIQDEHVRKANEDPAWLNKHYYEYSDGVYHRRNVKDLVDGAPLPVLKTLPDGSFIAKSDMPSAPSAIKVGKEVFGVHTAPEHVLPELHKITADRNAAYAVEMAQRAVRDSHSPVNLAALDEAMAAFERQVSENPRPPNSKIAEKMGELAAHLHVMPKVYPDAVQVKLMETGNGANRFDSLYEYRRSGKSHYVVVEEKGPGAHLGWSQGKADPPNLAKPEVDNGGAQGFLVQQGTRKYLRTIFAKMASRGEDVLAEKLRTALEEGRLEYIQVKANMPDGDSYAGATKWRFVM
ncbi:hypothetical protein [Streptomyces sp. NPDC002221]|uniref:hypothetical protein n=1 Tax=Streptomyces sp. NPDC002221 TaxID=3364639 RepID=UPI0036A5CEA2